MNIRKRHNLKFLAAWLLILAFFSWTVNLLLNVQNDWAQSNEITRIDRDVYGLFNPWRNLNRPGNDVLENYDVELQNKALENYLAEYSQARIRLEAHSAATVPMADFYTGMDEVAATAQALASRVLQLATEREALRLSGAAPDSIRLMETEAATTMARMDQVFQDGLDLIAKMDERLDQRLLDLVASRRASIGSLYLIVLVVLLSSALSLLLLRRTATQGEALRSSAERLQLAAGVFEYTTEGIMITDRHGTIQSTNPAFTAMTGFTADEVAGENPRILQSGMQSADFYEAMWRSITESGHWQGEINNRRKNGEIYPQWLNINAIKDARGQVTNYVGVAFDISELKASERLKDEFISTVSHELRTPLTSIYGSLSLLGGGVTGDPLSEDSAKLVRIAQENSQRLIRLIDDILGIAKIETEKMPFHLQPVVIEDLIAHAIEANQDFAKQYGVRLEIEPENRTARVWADMDRLMQVMTNLLSNAVKYSPRGGMVLIGAQRQAEYWRVSVVDNGPGIPDSFRDSVFSKFAQADGSDRRRGSGTGLGLSICKAIIDRLGGRIGFESESGVRTSFYFDLPVMQRNGISSERAVPSPEQFESTAQSE